MTLELNREHSQPYLAALHDWMLNISECTPISAEDRAQLLGPSPKNVTIAPGVVLTDVCRIQSFSYDPVEFKNLLNVTWQTREEMRKRERQYTHITAHIKYLQYERQP